MSALEAAFTPYSDTLGYAPRRNNSEDYVIGGTLKRDLVFQVLTEGKITSGMSEYFSLVLHGINVWLICYHPHESKNHWYRFSPPPLSKTCTVSCPGVTGRLSHMRLLTHIKMSPHAIETCGVLRNASD